MLSEGSAVNVVHIVRPLIPAEKNGGAEDSLRTIKADAGTSYTITVGEGGGGDEDLNFRSESCISQFNLSTSAEQLFQDACVKEVKDLRHGFNNTVLVVGSPQAGKTTVVCGNDKDVGLGSWIMRKVASLAEDLRMDGKHVLLSFSAAEFVPAFALGEEERDPGNGLAATKIRDLLNPHGRPMRVVEREAVNQVIIDGLTEVVLKHDKQLEELFLQASRLRRLGVPGDARHHAGSDALYRVRLGHCDPGQKLKVVSKLDLIDTAGYTINGKTARGVNTLFSCVENMGSTFQKGRRVPVKDSLLTHAIKDSFGGNTKLTLIEVLSPSNKVKEDTKAVLKLGNWAKNISNERIVNVDQTDQVIDDTRKELMRRKEALSEGTSSIAKTEILELEKLVEELKLAKKNSFEEKIKETDQLFVERIKNLATVGMLDYVIKSGKRGLISEQLDTQLTAARESRDAAAAHFRDQRKKVDAIKTELDKQIDAYAAKANEGSKDAEETKNIVKAIHETKEKMTAETAKLTQLKEEKKKHQDEERRCREAARFHSNEMLESVPDILLRSEAEERRLSIEENKDAIKSKISELKSELEFKKLQAGEDPKPEAKRDLENLSLQHDAIIAKQEAVCAKEERELLHTHLETNLRRHQRQLEELMGRQTKIFREYRQSCENQKMAVDSRYRHLLEEAIQDAVFLSSRNTELKHENSRLKKELARKS